ncbi:MAG: BMP family ABC transporter substrate-binding protein [Oscillospiraceae bacterium]|nr:BMP family ABC transporter substrate-binding protein [Oscillospiraceae bacterium]
MRLYKKVFAGLLCAMFGLFFLGGCGDSEPEEPLDISDLFATNEYEDPYPLDIKVGFIYSGSVVSDPMAAVFEAARVEVERTLGAETCYIENVRVQQFGDAVEKLKEDGCKVIVSASNHFNSAIVIEADKHYDLYFISFGGIDQGINLASIQPLLYQAANINGFVAAFNTETNKIGMVVDNNLYNAYGIANAFALGVRELPNAQIDVALNWALSDRYADTRAAIDDLIAYGCDIIFVYQSEEYAIKRCEELGVKVIGFAYNMPELAPENYLTGMYMNLNTFIIDKVRNVMYGNTGSFGGLARRGLNHGTVGIVMLNEDLVKDGTRTLADALLGHVAEERSPVFSGEIRDRNEVLQVEKGEVLQPQQIFGIRWITNIVVREENMSPPLTEADLHYSDLIIKN